MTSLKQGHTFSVSQVKEELLTMEPKDRPMPRCSLGSGSGLPYGSFVNSLSTRSLTVTEDEKEKPATTPRSSYVAVAVLCYINLLNYSERYTIAGEKTSCASTNTRYLCGELTHDWLLILIQVSFPKFRNSLT
ncbi:Protein spinster 3 [Liparis tanakae]|uniref:Protein spinster 3 n=1 Tax=Liparis tanakae TaxID=230148 RepID=A0A4Z2E125_9TELE|nr:Protein spinster 3 [Liparis tanakae]